MSTKINQSNQTITQYNVQTGAASNLLNSVAPSATSGIPVISQGAAAQPIFGTCAIAGGGTSLTSTPTNGQLLIGNTGTSSYNLATLTSGAGISITNGAGSVTVTATTPVPVLTPVFLARQTATTSNVTGDGTNYTIIFDTADKNIGSAYDTTTGIFTAPDTDTYILMFCVETGDIGAAHTLMDLKISTGSGNQAHGFYGNPFNSAVSGRFQVSQCVAMNISGLDTAFVSFTVSNGTKIVDVIGAASYETWFSGYRLSGSGGGGGGGSVIWTDVTVATQTLAVQNGYLTDRGGGVTYTLPATAAIGDTIQIMGKLGITTITQAAGQQIKFTSASTTVGVTGTCVSLAVGDCIVLVCITAGASTLWMVEAASGNWVLS